MTFRIKAAVWGVLATAGLILGSLSLQAASDHADSLTSHHTESAAASQAGNSVTDDSSWGG